MPFTTKAVSCGDPGIWRLATRRVAGRGMAPGGRHAWQSPCHLIADFMLMPLNRIIIFVGDVQKCARFYIESFGFTPLVSDDAPTEWIELDTGGCRLAFHKAHGPDGAIDAPTGSSMSPHKIVFYAQDVAAARSAVVASGAVMGDVRTFGSLTLCNGHDPEGHVFQISNRR